MTSPTYFAAEPVSRLVEEFHKLPGIGPKMAQRLTYYLVRMPEEEARSLAEGVLEHRNNDVWHDVHPLIVALLGGRD